MSYLIQRPEYIKYQKVTGALRRKPTKSDFEKIEGEKALFQWALPHCFMNSKSPWLFYLLFLSIFWLPYFLIFFRAVYVNLFKGGQWFDSTDITILWCGGLLFIFCVVLCYLWRIDFHNVVYKITESGLLEDRLKSGPKFIYRRQSSEKFIPYMQLIAVPLIILAIFVDPLMLAGAGAMVFYAFLPAQVTEAELAQYIAIRWDKHDIKGDDGDDQLVRISTKPKRFIICLWVQISFYEIYCRPDNYEEIKAFLVKKFPNATYDEKLYQQ